MSQVRTLSAALIGVAIIVDFDDFDGHIEYAPRWDLAFCFEDGFLVGYTENGGSAEEVEAVYVPRDLCDDGNISWVGREHLKTRIRAMYEAHLAAEQERQDAIIERIL